MKPWLVAHRGASHEAKENTAAAFKRALKYPISMIEFDVRITADNVAIIHHDKHIDDLLILQTPYATLLKHEPTLAIFSDIVTIANGLPLVVELKGEGSSHHVYEYLQAHPKSVATSFITEELLSLKTLGISGSRMFLARHTFPIKLQTIAKQNGFGGVTVNKWYLTPFFYWRAKKNNLNVFVYTINSLPVAWLIRKLYPSVIICTDKPHLLQKLS